MSDAQDEGATSEEAAWLLASEPDMYQDEMEKLKLWAGMTKPEGLKEEEHA